MISINHVLYYEHKKKLENKNNGMSILSSTRTGKKSFYTLFPKDRSELKKMIKKEINEKGNKCSLNHIYTSEIVDMSFLFQNLNFNGDISKWDVSNVEDMGSMFADCPFNRDISEWDVSKVENMCGIFARSEFNNDISKWNISKVTDMSYAFFNSKFNKDISNWKLNENCETHNMFISCPLKLHKKPLKNNNRIILG